MGQLAEKKPPDLAALYEQDLCAWAQANADLLRVGQLADIDAARIAEELEDMGKSERRSLRSHARNLMVHLLKWQHQPEQRCTSWELSILNACNEIEDILVESPSLVPAIPRLCRKRLPSGKENGSVGNHARYLYIPQSLFLLDGTAKGRRLSARVLIRRVRPRRTICEDLYSSRGARS